MDEKTALIIGTSHSFGACMREENGEYKFKDRVKHPNRWQDNLENYGYKVTTFARAGCTAQHQLDAFYHYINDNPNFYWDLIIIEGRDPESFVAYPTYIPTKNKDSKHLWLHWLSADNDDTITRIKKFNFDVRTAEDKQTTSWYKEYVLSDLHLIDVWSVNSALCSLASNYAKVVKWFTFGCFTSVDQKSIDLQDTLIGKYCIKNTLPSLYHRQDNLDIFLPKKGTKTRCYCGHFS